MLCKLLNNKNSCYLFLINFQTINCVTKNYSRVNYSSCINQFQIPKYTSIFQNKFIFRTQNNQLEQNKTVQNLIKNQPKHYFSKMNQNENVKINNIISKQDPSNMIWIDCEMTGLDTINDNIIEIGCIITNKHLEILDSVEIVINVADEKLNNMNEWCKKHHGASGLIEKCKNSQINIEQCEKIMLEFVKKYVPEKTAPMIGNSIYMDRYFILREMPTFNEYLHYRIIDISSLKQLAALYNPTVSRNAPKKKFNHRALDDIKDTIEEFRHYKINLLKIEELN